MNNEVVKDAEVLQKSELSFDLSTDDSMTDLSENKKNDPVKSDKCKGESVHSLYRENNDNLLIGDVSSWSSEGLRYYLSDYYDARNISQQTPLHIAVGCHFIEGVQFLLQQEVNIHAVDNSGRTPLQICISSYEKSPSDCFIICEMLLKAGACSKSTDSLGNTGLHTASKLCDILLFQLFSKSLPCQRRTCKFCIQSAKHEKENDGNLVSTEKHKGQSLEIWNTFFKNAALSHDNMDEDDLYSYETESDVRYSLDGNQFIIDPLDRNRVDFTSEDKSESSIVGSNIKYYDRSSPRDDLTQKINFIFMSHETSVLLKFLFYLCYVFHGIQSRFQKIHTTMRNIFTKMNEEKRK